MKNMIFPVKTQFEQSLPYYMDGVGCDYEQEDVNRPNGHPYYQWIQVHRGKGELHLHGKRYVLSEGQGMLLFPAEPHSYKRIGEVWDVDWIIFYGSGIENFIRNIAKIKGSGVYHIENFHSLAEKIAGLYNAAIESGPLSGLNCSARIYEILTDIVRLSYKAQNSSINVGMKRLSPVLSYINENYSRPISLWELADIAGVTPQYLCSTFKKYVSRTPFEYINMIKIRKSKELLISNKNMQIKEAASLAGFKDTSYFCAMFRRFEHISPMEFKELHG